jgi:hypothetical protein
MKSRPPVAMLVAVLSLCFVLGLLSVLLRQPTDGNPGLERRVPTSRPTSHILPPETGADQTVILILGVDQLRGSRPTLRAVWFATYRLPAKGIFLMGLPVDQPTGGATSAPLHSLFAWSPDQGVDPGFLRALESFVALSPDVVLILDEVAFAALVDYLGGVELSGVQLDGQEVIAFLDLIARDPAASLQAQASILEPLSQQAPRIGDTLDLTPLTELMPEHGYLSVPAQELVGMVAPLLPIDPELIFVQLPESSLGRPADAP